MSHYFPSWFWRWSSSEFTLVAAPPACFMKGGDSGIVSLPLSGWAEKVFLQIVLPLGWFFILMQQRSAPLGDYQKKKEILSWMLWNVLCEKSLSRCQIRNRRTLLKHFSVWTCCQKVLSFNHQDSDEQTSVLTLNSRPFLPAGWKLEMRTWCCVTTGQTEPV